eukprot:CAMPEP_0170588186 /NCGR_PEP_ID=MMETSP0224-20130122/10697_1 /TAXON_ID=285029 /ORGANISM="Togula jolla, Strain CCCM 725" /LENGTH=107 /DNA_ID=CAMNT_0010911889 /DNA_START=633 /DNA_END=956 /DNA_ORIENTATION=-
MRVEIPLAVTSADRSSASEDMLSDFPNCSSLRRNSPGGGSDARAAPPLATAFDMQTKGIPSVTTVILEDVCDARWAFVPLLFGGIPVLLDAFCAEPRQLALVSSSSR